MDGMFDYRGVETTSRTVKKYIFSWVAVDGDVISNAMIMEKKSFKNLGELRSVFLEHSSVETKL